MDNVIIVGGVFFCVAWWVMYGRIVQAIYTVPELGKLDIEEPGVWPTLNIVIAACNEEQGIEAAITSLLEQDYPDLKIILVNDRSHDDTATIVNHLADDDRVTAIHIDELPEDWLGKVHALKSGIEKVNAEWVLLTDADINFKPGALKKSMAWALSKKVDHVALMPSVITKSYLLEMVIRTFGLMFLFSTRIHELEKPDTQAVIGVGAFNLVKKSTLDKSEGMEWLRMEVADDVGIGMLIKRAGGKSAFAFAQSLLSVAWYPSMAAMFAGLEKNLFGGGAHYQVVRLILMVVLMWLFVITPFAIVISPTPAWLTALAALTLCWLPAMAFVGKYTSDAPLGMGLLIPLGQLMISLMILRSGIMCILRGGIVWRGTLYPTEKLKKYQRIKF